MTKTDVTCIQNCVPFDKVTLHAVKLAVVPQIICPLGDWSSPV